MNKKIYVGIIQGVKDHKLLICEDVNDESGYKYIEVKGKTPNQAIMLELAKYIEKLNDVFRLKIYIPVNIGIAYLDKVKEGKQVKKWANKEEGMILASSIDKVKQGVKFINYGEKDVEGIGRVLKTALKIKYNKTTSAPTPKKEPIFTFSDNIYNKNDLASTNVNIYVRGVTDYTDEERASMYVSILSCRGVEKQISKKLKHSTQSKMMIQGSIDAISLLKRPCNVKIYTHTTFGVKKYNQSQVGDNKDLLEILFNKVKEGNHSLEIIVGMDHQERLRGIISELK